MPGKPTNVKKPARGKKKKEGPFDYFSPEDSKKLIKGGESVKGDREEMGAKKPISHRKAPSPGVFGKAPPKRRGEGLS